MRGFTLLELILVLVIMGILTFLGFRFLPKDRALADSEVLEELILQKRSNALGFRANINNNLEMKKVCINLDKSSLNKEENSSRVKYLFRSDIKAFYENNKSLVKKICFDEFGRVYEDNLTLDKLAKDDIIINLKYKKEINLTIYKFSGDVE